MRRYWNLFKNIKNWPLYLGKKAGLIQLDPLVFSSRAGLRIEVPRTLLSEFKEIFMEETYLRGFDEIFSDPKSIVDIGANVGFFSLFAGSKFPNAKVFSYEPIPVNFAQLERHLKMNPSLNARCYQRAVGGVTGEMSLCWNGDNSFTTSASVLRENGSQTLRVLCLSLPDMMESLELQEIDLLKMDCEGAEYEIIYQCTSEILRRIKRLAMEVHEGSLANENARSLDTYLREHGFRTRRSGSGPLSMLWATCA